MKKLFLSFILFTAAINALSAVPEEDNDQKEIISNLSYLNEIENEVLNSQDFNAEQYILENKSSLRNVNLESDAVSNNLVNKDLPLVGAFWWGCCLGVVGLLLVYIITDHDKSQIRKAFWGCAISTLLVGLGGIFDVFGWF